MKIEKCDNNHYQVVGEGVFRKVVLQRSEEDHRDQTDEEKDHHERIDHGEPVDLMLEKVVLEILVVPGREGNENENEKR